MGTSIIKIGSAEDLVSKWIEDAQVKDSSIATYKKCLRRLMEYLAANGLTKPTRADILAYREYLFQKYSVATAGLCLTAARMFFAFLQREGYIDKNPAEHVKGFKKAEGHSKSALSPEMVRDVLGKVDASELQGKRDKAIFALMVSCGLRCIEVERADVGDMENFSGVTRLHVQGKGRDDKIEAVNLPAGVVRLIKEYLEARGQVAAKDPLFASLSHKNLNGRMAASSISKIVKSAMIAAGYNSPRLTAHSLRHTAATTALKSGASLREVQQMMRHKDVSITTVYLHELSEIENPATNLNADKFGI